MKKKKKVGRPTKYHETITNLEEVQKLCGLGLTDEDLATFYNIRVSTLNLWKKKYPEFMESIKKGKIVANSKVKESLFKAAIGYDLPMRRMKYAPPQPFIRNPNFDPSKPISKDNQQYIENHDKKPVLLEVIETQRHYPPNPVAAINFLINRDNWRRGERKDEFGLDDSEIEALRKIAISIIDESL